MFEDGQALVFATPHAASHETLTSIEYEFDTLAAKGLYGVGWKRPLIAVDGSATRASRVANPYFVLRLQPSRPMEVGFRIVGGPSEEGEAAVTLKINDVAVILERREEERGGIIFRGSVPALAWSDSSSKQRIDFTIARNAIRDDRVRIADSKLPQIAFDWLRLNPEEVLQ